MMEAKPVLRNGLGVALHGGLRPCIAKRCNKQCRRGWGPCIAKQCNLRPLPVLASRRDAWKALGLGPVQRNGLGVALLCNGEGGGGRALPCNATSGPCPSLHPVGLTGAGAVHCKAMHGPCPREACPLVGLAARASLAMQGWPANPFIEALNPCEACGACEACPVRPVRPPV
jgi:hypothetical protein